MKKNFKAYIAFFLVLVISAVTFIYLFQKTKKQYDFPQINEATDYIHPDESTGEIGQVFKARDFLCGVQVRFTDVQKTDYKNGSFTLGVVDLQTNKVLKEIVLNSYKIQYYNPFCLYFDTVNDSSYGEYYVYVKFDEVEANNIGVGYIAGDDSGDPKMTVNGEDTDYNLNFTPIYKKVTVSFLFYAFLIGMMILIGGIYFVITKFNISIQKCFLIVITVFLLLGTYIMPLVTGHDESSHFYKAYDIARGNILPHIETDEVTGKDIIASEFPTAIRGACANNEFWNISYTTTLDALKQNIDYDDTFQFDTSITSYYCPVAYFPSVSGIIIAKFFTANAGLLFYAGRLSSALFSILILYLIMRMLPFGKKIFFVICLNPMVLSQLCTVTADTFTLLMSFLFIAYVLKIAYSPEKIKPYQMILLVVLSLCVALSKIVYLPLCFAVLLIRKEKFKNKKTYLFFMLTTITVSLIVSFTWLKVAGSFLLNFSSSSDQISYILSNPLDAIGAGLVSLKNESGTLLLNMFGDSIAWTNKVNCGAFVSFTMIFLTAITTICDDSIKERTGKAQKYLLGAIILSTILLVFVSIYVQWSPYAWKYINGVQGRYLLPVLPLALILLGSTKIKYDNQERISRMIYFSGLFPFTFAMICTVIEYI